MTEGDRTAELRSLFMLDPEIVFLNHGSFGAVPRPVFEEYQHWQGELERQPVEFLGRRAVELMAASRSVLAQAPQLYNTFSAGIHTNLSLEDGMKLAVLAKDIPIESIKQGVIDTSMAIPANTTLNGVPASVLRPVPDLIRVLRDEIFIPGGPVSPLAQGDAVTLMQEDGARIRVTNNTYTENLGERTASYLTAQGMQVVKQGVPTGQPIKQFWSCIRQSCTRYGI